MYVLKKNPVYIGCRTIHAFRHSWWGGGLGTYPLQISGDYCNVP